MDPWLAWKLAALVAVVLVMRLTDWWRMGRRT